MNIKSKINNGIFTLINKDKATHVTLKIHTAKQGNLKGKRIVSRLVGTDNEHSYKGFAFVNDNDGIIPWTTQRSQHNWQTVKILRSLTLNGANSQYADRVEMKLSKRCMRCNRRLTTPKSLKDGVGPECIKKISM